MTPKDYQLNDLLRNVAVFKNEQDYRRLFNALFPCLKGFAFTLLKSEDLAEEVASDVMITIWRKKELLTEVQNIKVYAFVIAKNLSLNVLKQQARHKLISLDDIDVNLAMFERSPEEILMYTELKEKIKEVTEGLPAKCKLVFKLVREDGFSYKEAGEILNISVKTVDAHLVAAVRKITAALKQEFNLSKY
ncbi:RNA polymerase sigma-70 factor [Mucilaginibacter gynuensis]|uniref:RNA polymerase sigma-70 factor n=1 Tax=Mucilaginibacter gynuensis TaxID=1302236 RepID=A0ABP8FP27_9SPHI